MQPFSFFFFVGYSLCVWGILGRVRALNLTVPLGSGQVGSDNLGHGPGSGFSFEPVQTSIQVWNNVGVIQLCQNFYFGVNINFKRLFIFN